MEGRVLTLDVRAVKGHEIRHPEVKRTLPGLVARRWLSWPSGDQNEEVGVAALGVGPYFDKERKEERVVLGVKVGREEPELISAGRGLDGQFPDLIMERSYPYGGRRVQVRTTYGKALEGGMSESDDEF